MWTWRKCKRSRNVEFFRCGCLAWNSSVGRCHELGNLQGYIFKETCIMWGLLYKISPKILQKLKELLYDQLETTWTTTVPCSAEVSGVLLLNIKILIICSTFLIKVQQCFRTKICKCKMLQCRHIPRYDFEMLHHLPVAGHLSSL
jgi:hypothetical protein